MKFEVITFCKREVLHSLYTKSYVTPRAREQIIYEILAVPVNLLAYITGQSSSSMCLKGLLMFSKEHCSYEFLPDINKIHNSLNVII